MTTGLELIKKYFPNISVQQENQFSALAILYGEWNEKINVISRKDIDFLFERHILHSLSIAKIIFFKKDTRVLDFGTGGGFPGIPLAILFPEAHFHLVDSIGKKINVVKEISSSIRLENIFSEKERAENVKGKFDFIVSRAVADSSKMIGWTRDKLNKNCFNDIPNGFLFLKGGELAEELKPLKEKVKIFSLNDYFSEEFFETKKLVYIRI